MTAVSPVWHVPKVAPAHNRGVPGGAFGGGGAVDFGHFGVPSAQVGADEAEEALQRGQNLLRDVVRAVQPKGAPPGQQLTGIHNLDDKRSGIEGVIKTAQNISTGTYSVK